MRAPGDILLLATYELGRQPLHLASPLAFLEAAGYRPRAIDLAVERFDDEAARTARAVAIAAPMHTGLRLALAAIDRFRPVNAHAAIFVYGLYAPLYADLLRARGVQAVLGGEYEAALVEAVGALEAGRPAAGDMVSLARLTFPRPSRASLRPLDRYARLLHPDGRARLVGAVEASRGCKYLCRHCPIPSVYGGRFFVVPREIVLDDISALVDAGAEHITFGDPDFLNGPRHALELARAMHARHPSLTFDATTKIEHLVKHADTLPELAALGCLFVVSAVESLSDRVLAILDKGHTRADVDAALAACRAARITLRPSLVAFTPWTTLDDYLALFDWIEREALFDAVDPVHLAIRLLVPPGSLLLTHPEARGLFGPFDAATLVHPWAHPDARMDVLQAAAMAVCEEAAAAGEEPQTTFYRLKALALTVAAGRPLPPAPPPRPHAHAHPPPSQRAPKLTETWFC
jgi:radical SAM superfamily enzyme YgiQ (UPF0313 family)